MTKPSAPRSVPADVSREVRAVIERFEDMALDYNQLVRDAEATGTIDRARLRGCLTAYGQTRRELLTVLGEEPDSENLLPLPAELRHV